MLALLLFSTRSCGSKDIMLAQRWKYVSITFDKPMKTGDGTELTPSESLNTIGQGIANMALQGMEWEFHEDKTYLFRCNTFLGKAEEKGAFEWAENDKYLLLVSPGDDKHEANMHKLTMISLTDDTLVYRPENLEGAVLKFAAVRE